MTAAPAKKLSVIRSRVVQGHEWRSLRDRAEVLWPESITLQLKWMKAVVMVRATTDGWLLERPVGRQ